MPHRPTGVACAKHGLDQLFAGTATVWAVGGQALQPLYAGGAIRSAYKLAWAQWTEAELSYRQTVQVAFGDVASSLVSYSQSRLFRIKIEEQTNTYKETARLANVRFTNGSTSFLEVLVTQQQYFNSQLALAQAWNADAKLCPALSSAGRRMESVVHSSALCISNRAL